MSFVVAVPESVTAAAENLAEIGATLADATAAASASTTGVAVAAADEVSAAVAQLFGSYGRDFQSVSAQAAAFHADFVRVLNGGAEAYLSTEIANAETVLTESFTTPAQALEAAVSSALWTPGAAAAVPGGAYGRLVANTTTNLQALGSAWAADPFPFLRQFLANQQFYAQQIATAVAGAIENLPATMANLPATIQAAVQQALSFNAAYYAQQFIATQIGFAQTFFTSASKGLSALVAGLPQFASGLQLSFQQVLAGNYNAAVADLGTSFANLLVTGVDTGPVTATIGATAVTLAVNPTLLGPLGDFFTIMNLPGQEAQYLTNLTSPPLLRHVSQNFTNVLNTLTLPSISATLVQPYFATGTLSAFFGMPLVLTYAAAGGPFSALNALATSLDTFTDALATGNVPGALGAVIDAPANALDGFLNARNILNTVIQVPTGLAAPSTVTITLHLPVDGVLVPPHPVTATIDPHLAPLVNPIEVTVYGTPFMGMGPLLINYIPQQLALAIKPAA